MSDHNNTTNSRRNFLSNGLKTSLLAALFSQPSAVIGKENWFDQIDHNPNDSAAPLKILILGGTSFLGPHQIAYALGRGHEVTTFTRGRTKPTIHTDLFKKVEALVGDREDNLEALKGRKWDVVIDNSGRRAKWTKDTATLLKDNVGLYLYTSSTGVYYPYLGDNIQEDTKLVLEVPPNIDEYQALEYNYGVMKSNSENEAKKAFGEDRTVVVRPTYMMGPGDRTDRFTYWPLRLSRGGEVLVPGKAADPVQYIDVRDVANWMIRLIEVKNAGTFNAVGPASPTGMHAFVYGAHAAFSSAADFVMIPDYSFLEKHKVPYAIPWIMPVGENYGSARVNNQHGIENGLTFTPLAKSVTDIHDWWYSGVVGKERQDKLMAGKDSLMAREKTILDAWKSYK